MKSFRNQFIECKTIYNRREEWEVTRIISVKGIKFKVPTETILWCNKFEKQCKSSTCKDMRTKEVGGTE